MGDSGSVGRPGGRFPIGGAEVVSIEGQYAVGFDCTGSVFINIEDPYEVCHDGEVIVVDPCDGKPELADVRRVIVGARVAYAEYDADEVLTVFFESGARLRVLSNVDGYESWDVHWPPDHIFIGTRVAR